ncbi:MAG: NAD(P)-dependent glycerol-3-phosphate dehydrogenase [Oligoflexales bacterium]|nr:NAD(P)-dependent glycerol-3-phosphate dehydrogenase [Oligoflexales bacterium]
MNIKILPGKKKIIIIGAGNFGTCLAQHFASKGYEILIYARSKSVVESINKYHCNPKYLCGHVLSRNIHATEAITSNEIHNSIAVVISIPTQFLRSVLLDLKEHINGECLLLNTAKGLENLTLFTPSEIICDVLGDDFRNRVITLSGPSFAEELIEHQPTCVSIAGKDPELLHSIQILCHTPFFRTYTSKDQLGLEIAGALKNVIAIAAGACVGLGYQQNSLASLITRGLAEITRIGVSVGADPLTFSGLSGIGDLILSCTSHKSRNFSVGYQIGQGTPISNVIDNLTSVAEGIPTTESAYMLTKKFDIDAPITEQVYFVLFKSKNIKNAVQFLINRDPKPELTF